MAEVIVIGGGLAGLATAAALGGAGHRVKIFEMKPFLGGRATSYEVGTGGETEFIDNCQHILLRCCVNLLDFYKRLGVENEIEFHKEFVFIEPGGRRSLFKAGALPTPAHFAESFLHLTFLNWSEKLAVAGQFAEMIDEGLRAFNVDRMYGGDVKASDLTLERFLDAKLLAEAPALPPAVSDIRTVLLTGATGLLGNYLLRDLLLATEN